MWVFNTPQPPVGGGTGWWHRRQRELAREVDKRAATANMRIVGSTDHSKYPGERQLRVKIRKGISNQRAASVLQGVVQRVFGKSDMAVYAKTVAWSEIVVVLNDPAGTKAWNAARRLCKTNKRVLVPRNPHWLYQDDKTTKRGSKPGTLRFTIVGVRPDQLRDAPYRSYGVSIKRVYDVFHWNRDMGKGNYKDKEGFWRGGYTKEYGTRQGRQASPKYSEKACQRCGMYNHKT